MKKALILFLLFISVSLSSCSSPVNYTVDKEHEPKMKIVQKLILSLVENNSDSYLSCFEPDYIKNVEVAIDKLGMQYYGAKDFDDFMKSFFANNKDHMSQNYGSDITVDLSFNSVETVVLEDTGIFTDDYSIGYKLPFDKIKSSVKVSTKIIIKGSKNEDTTVGTFVLIELSDSGWHFHPDSFLFSI